MKESWQRRGALDVEQAIATLGAVGEETTPEHFFASHNHRRSVPAYFVRPDLCPQESASRRRRRNAGGQMEHQPNSERLYRSQSMGTRIGRPVAAGRAFQSRLSSGRIQAGQADPICRFPGPYAGQFTGTIGCRGALPARAHLPTDDLTLDRLPRGLHMIHRFDPPDQFFPPSGLQSHIDLALERAWLISVLAFPAFVLPPFRHDSPLSERSRRVFARTALIAISFSYQITCYLL